MSVLRFIEGPTQGNLGLHCLGKHQNAKLSLCLDRKSDNLVPGRRCHAPSTFPICLSHDKCAYHMNHMPSTWSRHPCAKGIVHAPRALLFPYTHALGMLAMFPVHLKMRGTSVFSCYYFGQSPHFQPKPRQKHSL